MKISPSVRLLFLSHESWPTFRPDVAVLFGKYLPRLGVTSDLVTERTAGKGDDKASRWGGGEELLYPVPPGRAGRHLAKFWHNLCTLLRPGQHSYDAIQVRDMPVVALAGVLVARARGLPFIYWMSFPQSEGQIARARGRGPRAGLAYWFPLMQGMVGKWLLYSIVLPRADHVFVQTKKMREDVAARGIPLERMTAVPMGVDLEAAQPQSILPADDPRLAGRRVLVYLGALDRARSIETLFSMLAIVRKRLPEALLVLAGDTEDAAHRAWLRRQAEDLGVADAIIWTGWLPTSQAWRYVRAAEIGLSPIPRGFLLDCGSPTKAVEYMALGLPVLGNDNPDQAQAVSEGQAGICVPLEPQAFADAALAMLADQALRQRMGDAGQRYVARMRSYERLAALVASSYVTLLRRHRCSEVTQ